MFLILLIEKECLTLWHLLRVIVHSTLFSKQQSLSNFGNQSYRMIVVK